MNQKVLVVAIVQNEKGEILLRKKPDGSPPYAETWYIFGAELQPGQDSDATLYNHIKLQTGLEVRIVDRLGWDEEIKSDLDGIIKHFVYLDVIAHLVDGELSAAPGIEKLEWVPKSQLSKYDNVPPSLKLFKKLGWIHG